MTSIIVGSIFIGIVSIVLGVLMLKRMISVKYYLQHCWTQLDILTCETKDMLFTLFNVCFSVALLCMLFGAYLIIITLQIFYPI